MSKKKKGQPVVAATSSASRPQPAPVRAISAENPARPKPVNIPETERPFELIRFDKRVKWFISICTVLFVLLTLAKINYSSVGVWNQIIPDGSAPNRGVLSGTPRTIRMDDYAVAIPWILSQDNKGYPHVNEVIGGAEAPVVFCVSNHFFTLFKPAHWGFVLFGAEYGYAWFINVVLFGSLIGITLLLLLLTGNNFWLSLFGSLWILFSSATQSWTYIPIYPIATACLLCVAGAYLLFSQSKIRIIVSAVALPLLLIHFMAWLYPPYQVPLAFAMLAMFIGFCINRYNKEQLAAHWPLRVAGVLIALLLLGGFGYLIYTDIKPTLATITNTVYPGKRSEHGGSGFIANWFSEYFSWLVTDTKIPKGWLNHCEQSHYLTFAPIIIPSLLVIFLTMRKVDWTLLLLTAYIVFFYVYIEIGIPDWLAKMTLIDTSPSRRAQVPFGMANVFFTVLYLHFLTKIRLVNKPLFTAIGVLSVVAFMVYAGYVNINDSDGFFKWHQLFLPIVFFSLLGILLLPTWSPQYRGGLFCVGILLFLLPNAGMNPIAKGLTPITQNTLYQTVQSIGQQEPKARWVVFGSQYLAYMVTATGVNTLSGVKITPPRVIYNVLDPAMKRDSAYNRYAHTVYTSFINGRDSSVIYNPFEDGCTVAMDPCSPRLKQLNVKYIIFDKDPQPVETRCMKLVSRIGSIRIYRVND